MGEFNLRAACPCLRRHAGHLQPNKALIELAVQGGSRGPRQRDPSQKKGNARKEKQPRAARDPRRASKEEVNSSPGCCVPGWQKKGLPGPCREVLAKTLQQEGPDYLGEDVCCVTTCVLQNGLGCSWTVALHTPDLHSSQLRALCIL